MKSLLNKQKSSLDQIGKIFHQYVTKPSQLIITAEEKSEIIERSNELVRRVQCEKVNQKRWETYLDMNSNMISSRHVKSRRSALGTLLLGNFTFFWDDVEDHLVKDRVEIMKAETERLCRDYYPPGEVKRVMDASLQWINHDTYFRTSPSKEILCKHLNSYWQFRLIDSGTHYFMVVSSPIYENQEYNQLIDMQTLSNLTLKPFMVVNDIVSIYKEKVFNECSNFLNITEDYEKEIEDVAHDMKCINTLDGEIKQILFDKIYGHYSWAIRTERYQPKITEVNYRIRSEGEENKTSLLGNLNTPSF
jgi:hypothetical protein